MKNYRTLRHPLSILLSTVMLLSGCATQPTTQALVTATQPPPQQWQASNQTPLNPAAPQEWLQQFHSEPLKQLINEALQHNHTIQRARISLQSAQQQTIITHSTLLPTTTGKLSTSRARTHSSGVEVHSSGLGLELSSSWEADLWDRLSDLEQAALQRETASATELNAAQLSLVAEVTRNWFSAIESKLQITLSRQRLKEYQKAESVIEQRYRSGITGALDLHLARSEVAIAEERLASQQLQQQQQLRTLETLVGRYPAATLTLDDTLPNLKEQIPVGIPATLLQRRPDIEASYQRLQAAHLDTLAAGKDRLPSFSLTAKGGSSSSELNNLLDWDYLVWSLLGNLTQPLFQQDKLAAQEQIKQLAQQQSAIDYAETVLQAFREVENSLSADHLYKLRAEALARASHESRQAAALALAQYQGGIVDILTLLNAQQRAYDRQSAQLQAQAARIDNRIQLHLALGGDYR